MATTMLLKTKPNPKLPLQFIRSSISILTRPVQPEPISEAPQLFLSKASSFSLLGLFAGESGFASVRNGVFALVGDAVFARQIGTSRSPSSTPRGSSSRDDEEEDVDDVDEDEGDKIDDGETYADKSEDYDGQLKESRGRWHSDDGEEEFDKVFLVVGILPAVTSVILILVYNLR